MKPFNLKRLLFSFLLSACAIFGITGIQLASFYLTGFPFGAVASSGGEYNEYAAFAFKVVKIYPLVDLSKPNHPRVSTSIEWNIARLVVWILVLTACFYMIGTVRQKKEEEKQS